MVIFGIHNLLIGLKYPKELVALRGPLRLVKVTRAQLKVLREIEAKIQEMK